MQEGFYLILFWRVLWLEAYFIVGKLAKVSCAHRGSFARPPFSTLDSSVSVARHGGFVLPCGDLHSQPPIKTILPFYGDNTLCPQEGRKKGPALLKNNK